MMTREGGNNNQMSQPYQLPTQPYPPGQPPAPPQPEPKKSWIKRKLGWLPLTVVLVLASCGVIVTAMGSSDDSTDTSAIEATSTDPTPSEKSEPEPEASQVPTVEIGEKVRDEGYQFTVTKVTCGVKRVGSSYLGEKAQGQFCLVNMRVKNISKEPINFSDENQALVDTKGREYSPDDEAWIYIDDSDPFAEINPGNTLRTTVPFDVSKHARPDYLLLKAGVWGFSDGVRVKL